MSRLCPHESAMLPEPDSRDQSMVCRCSAGTQGIWTAHVHLPKPSNSLPLILSAGTILPTGFASHRASITFARTFA